MGISLPHFWQMNGAKAKVVVGCDDLWDQDGRADLAWTMMTAEEMIARELGFWPAPKFITREQIPFGLTGVRRDWTNAEVKTGWGYVEGYGVERLTLLEDDAGVEYLDLDNDPAGREETARIGTAIYADLPACAGPCEVAVFFRTADGAEDAGDDRWEIRPIKVDIDGSSMRITADSALFIRPDLLALTKADCAGSPDTAAWRYDFELTNLVTAVDVYCRTINTETPVTLYWDGVCGCAGGCEHRTQTACAYVTDEKRGFFAPRPATWSGTANVWAAPTYGEAPESLTVNYRAGYPLDSRTCQMNAQLERAIVKLTNALLPEPPCGFCDPAQTRWHNDRKNLDPLTLEAAGLPWDLYTQGALEAWRIVKRFAMGKGGKAGRGYRG